MQLNFTKIGIPYHLSISIFLFFQLVFICLFSTVYSQDKQVSTIGETSREIRILRAPWGEIIPMPIFDLNGQESTNAEFIKQRVENGTGAFSARSRLSFGGGEEEARSINLTISRLDFIVENAPEAMLLLSLTLRPNSNWIQAHPDELYEDYNGEKGDRPSLYSTKEKQAVRLSLANLFDSLKTRPYYNRIIGAFLGKYRFGEWAVYDASPDYSEPARIFYKEFLRKKYGTVENMRSAWGDPTVTFDNFLFPRESRINLGAMIVESQASKDNREAGATALAGQFYDACKAVKEVNPGFITGGFYSYANSNQAEIRQFLGDGTIDFVCTPIEYINRQSGGGMSSQSPYMDMPYLHNAVFFDELDGATHISPRAMNNVGRPRTVRESVGVLWRDLGQMLVRGHAGWWLDFNGRPGHMSGYTDIEDDHAFSYHLGEDILRVHRDFAKLYEDVENFDRSSCAEIKVFYPRRNNYIDFWDIMWIKRIEFPMAGIPVEEYELDDLLEGLVKPGKVNILYWPVSLSNQEIDKIHELQSEYKADWVYYGPTAMLDPSNANVPDIERMEQVTGFKLNIEWLVPYSEAGSFYHPSRRSYRIKALPDGRLKEEELYTLPYIGQSQKHIYSKNVPFYMNGWDLQKNPEPPIEIMTNYRIGIKETSGTEILARYDNTPYAFGGLTLNEVVRIPDPGRGADGGGDYINRNIREPAFAARKTANGNIYCYPLPIFNSDLFRVLAKWAGCNIYIGEDAFLCATNGMFLLHQARNGEYQVHLPGKPVTIRDLITGKDISLDNNIISLSGQKGDTHLLQIDH
jgi:hypothetical protein